jgi:hypothetical protein
MKQGILARLKELKAIFTSTGNVAEAEGVEASIIIVKNYEED